MKNTCDILVIGGGAAGFFAAIHASGGGKNKVVVLEKTSKLLTKVAVSGGGRCNVTHDCPYPAQLVQHYPRGGKNLRKSFDLFNTRDTIRWFESRGVAIKTEDDGRMFPVSNQSQTIVNCLLAEAEKAKIAVIIHMEVTRISPLPEGGFSVFAKSGETHRCRKLIVTCGGFQKMEGYNWLIEMGLAIVPPVPSLFTFNVPDSDLTDLMGLSVADGVVQVPGGKWKETGPVLITHWGFSAPAVIKLSSKAAIELHDLGYHFPVLINWTGQPEHEVRAGIEEFRNSSPNKMVMGNPCFDIPSRLWVRLVAKSGIGEELKFTDLPAKLANRLIELLVRSSYDVRGKTTFKEEFVTCGGIDLSEVNLLSFETKKIPGLYFAGEVLNVDGLTGGFNFQHAWTSGFLAGKHAAEMG